MILLKKRNFCSNLNIAEKSIKTANFYFVKCNSNCYVSPFNPKNMNELKILLSKSAINGKSFQFWVLFKSSTLFNFLILNNIEFFRKV